MLSVGAQWGFGCGNATAANHDFTLPELQAAGWALGSTVADVGELTAQDVVAMAARLLGMVGEGG